MESGEGGGGVVLVPHAGWLLWLEGRQIPNTCMTVQDFKCVLHLKLSVQIAVLAYRYVSNVQTLMHYVNEAENFHP